MGFHNVRQLNGDHLFDQNIGQGDLDIIDKKDSSSS